MVLNTGPTRLDRCQYPVSGQINYTLTNFADHSLKFSHDQLNRYLRGDKLTPRLVWEQTRGQIITSPGSYLIFDDTVADKNHCAAIKLVRRQWSGNTHSVIRGIEIVTLIYVNPELDRFWLIDYRLFAPDEEVSAEALPLFLPQTRLPCRVLSPLVTPPTGRRLLVSIQRFSLEAT